MTDAADKVVADDEQAMALFEKSLRDRRAVPVPEPTGPIDCVECGRTVSVERQRAYPRTRRCVPCAAEIERAFDRGCPA